MLYEIYDKINVYPNLLSISERQKMKETVLFFSKLHPKKISISFTWDDNFSRHIEFIAPTFRQYYLKCTFYVNPGEPDFVARLAPEYAQLSMEGFEIGSHGYTHHHFSKLTEEKYMDQLIQSKKAIESLTQKIPITFAFPHHDFTQNMLDKAYHVYFETRNTLNNTPRFSLKSNTSLSDVENALKSAVSNKNSIVFSGHSISLCTDKNYLDGYEPISLDNLHDILKKVLCYKEYADICTFEQASLKEYIRNNCCYTNEQVKFTGTQMSHLENFGITFERIKEMI